MCKDFVIIADNHDIVNANFILMKKYNNEYLIKEYCQDISQLFRQVCIDVPRMDVYIEDMKTKHVDDILLYISSQPCLKHEKKLIFLFLTQIILSIPAILLSEIMQKLDKDLILSEPTSESRPTVILYPDAISVNKKLRGVVIDEDNIHTILQFDICMDVDILTCEMELYIKGDKK
jgi:hypothetical protein